MGLVFELLGYATGETILYVLTLGRRKPRWPNEGPESSVLLEVMYQGSTWLGLLFWALVLAIIAFIAL